MEVLTGGESLTDQTGADDLALGLHERPGGLLREDHSGDAGDDPGVGETRQERHHQEHPERREQLAAHLRPGPVR